MPTFIAFLYLPSAVLFILAIEGLASPKSAVRGNLLGIVGMVVAIIATLMLPNMKNFPCILLAIAIGGVIGTFLALKVKMTDMPQMVALFNALVGLAAMLISIVSLFPETAISKLPINTLVEINLSILLGGVTFSGSLIAFLKLQRWLGGATLKFRGQHLLNLLIVLLVAGLMGVSFFSTKPLLILITLSLVVTILGITLVLPIGGADMPVVISVLNSYSGWATCGVGFTLQNTALIITGALVGASGAILSYIMCKAMNRSLVNVIFGGLGSPESTVKGATQDKSVKQGSPTDAAFLLQNASSVIIVPGYGMAVAQAQHAVSEMAQLLRNQGIQVRYAIHPVAGRMPGHMNVLLAEANVDYEHVLELDEINTDFKNTDVAFVIGANDITNPAAKTDKTSPIYGMPILDVENAKTVIFVKRSLAAGYAGIDNELFYRDNTMMVFGDAKKVTENIIKELKI